MNTQRTQPVSLKSTVARLTILLLLAGPVFGQPKDDAGNPAALKTHVIPLDLKQLTLEGVNAELVTYQGQQAIHLSGKERGEAGMAIVGDYDIQDGEVELDLAGLPGSNVPSHARGFIGIAFRVAPDAAGYEFIYLRPTNGRADDQLRRNHSTQYASFPDYDFDRLRNESPGVYESYVDLVTGGWTRFRLVFKGRSAALYVNGASQPCLIVNDLKRGIGSGKVGLYIGNWTEGYFSNVRITENR